MDQYQHEAKRNWGETEAYQTYEDKTAHYTKAQWAEIQGKMDEIMMTFARYRQEGLAPESIPVQTMVGKWQQFLTQYYYDCTDEILGALGRMYGVDERFWENINRYGAGTAELLSAGIEIFCR